MRTTVRVGGQVVTVRDGSLEIEQAVEERATCRFVVVDEDGVWRFHKGQQVSVTDDDGATVFGGVIDAVEEHPITDAGGIFHAIAAVDWHYLADKRIVATSYENQTAGAIVGDIVTRYLGAEGVRGGAVVREWETATDWAAGTFTDTVGTPGGAVVLDRAGVDVHRTEGGGQGFAGGTAAGVRVVSGRLQLDAPGGPAFTRGTVGYERDGSPVSLGTPRYLGAMIGDGLMLEEGYLFWSFSMGSSYLYVDMTNVPNYTIQAGDRLVYDIVWHDPGNIQVAVDMSGPLGNLRDSGATDQYGRGVHPTVDLSSVAYQQWYHREIDLAPLVGKTMDAFMVACDADSGTARASVRNIAIVDSAGNVRHKIWASGDLAPTTAVSAGDTTKSAYSVTRVLGEELTIPAAAMPGAEGTIEAFMIPLVPPHTPRVGSTSPADTYWNIFTWGDITQEGFILRRGRPGSLDRLEVSVHQPGVGIVSRTYTRSFTQGTPYHLAVAWDATETKVYVNGSLVMTAPPFVVPGSTKPLTIGRPNGYRQAGAVIDDLRISRVMRSASEIAARWNGGAGSVAPVDRDTTYKLALDGSLTAGCGGYRIWPALDLSPAVVAAGSAIAWTDAVLPGASVVIETSIDGGASWQVATDGGAIPGIGAGTDLAGVSLLVRQTLRADNTAAGPELVSITADVFSGYAAQGTWESEPIALDPAAWFGGGTVTGTVTTPPGTAVAYETSVDDGQTWQAVGPGGTIVSLAEGTDLDGVSLRVRAVLQSGSGGQTPQVEALRVTVRGATVAEGPVIGGAVFNYITAAEAIGRLAERAGFWWTIDPDRVVWFQPRDAHVAPWAVTDADILRGTAVATEEAPKYRNRQYLVGVQVKTDPQVETVRGDGDTRAFTVGYPIAEEPTQIRVLRSGGAVEVYGPDEIGVKGVEADKAWYWSKGDPVVTQDEAVPVVGAADRVEITYRGQFPMVVVSDDPGAVAERQAYEGIGTGIVEDVSDAPSITTQRDAYDTAGAMLAKWARVGRVFRFATRRGGLRPGQLVTVHQPGLGIDGEAMLITQVVVREDYAGVVYDVTAAAGPASGSWAALFAAIAAAASGYIERLSSDRNETVVVTAPFAEMWGWAEVAGVTVAACLVPATDVYPSTSAYPC